MNKKLVGLALAVGMFSIAAPAFATGSVVQVNALQPDWSTGVFSAYYGPDNADINGYIPVSPGATAVHDEREAGIIKAGLNAKPDGHYDDEGLFGFKPTVTIDEFAAMSLTYDVENQEGTNPVWMTIEVGTESNRDANKTYQFVPTPYSAGWNTVNAGTGQWQLMDSSGNGTGDLMSLGAIATANTGLNVVRAYLRLGMGDSYHGTGNGTVAWVDKATIGGTTYDFVLAPDPCADNILDVPSEFASIQGAISHVTDSCSTIRVGSGTYTESGQIVINKNLTIVGADKATTIIKPAQNTSSSGDTRGWFLVPAGITFNLSNVTLDGTGHLIYMGLYYWGNGTVNDVNITNIKYQESGPPYDGRGIMIKGNVNVTNSTFTNIGRIGIQYFGGNGTASGNTYVGKGAGDWLDYAFDIDTGSNVNVENNTISNNLGVASSDGSGSAAILVSTIYGPGTQATVTGNTLTNNSIGIAVGYDGSDTAVVVAHNNNISGNTDGVVSTNPTVDATNNWWGNTSGPLATTTSVLNPAGTGSAAVGNVTFSPWYTNAAMTTLSNNTGTNATYTSTTTGQADLPTGATAVVLTDTTVLDLSNATTSESSSATIDGNTVVLTQSVVLQSGTDGTPVVLTNSNLVDVSASIPDGTKISGPAGWDGTIEPPMATSTSGNAPAGFSVGSTVISIGSPDGTLVFDKPVTILLAGVTGTIGYRPAGSNDWIQITNSCGDYTNPTSPTYPGECAVSNGTDTKILTYHFTSFGGLNSNPTPVSSNGGGGGPVGLVGTTNGGTGVGAAVIPTVPAGTVSTGSTGSTGGEVLGASAYQFSANLTTGSTGNDVIELQKVLIAEGDLSIGAPTGVFGPLTKAAVIKYQMAHKISPQSGYVGSMTRGVLGQGSEPTTPEVLGASAYNFTRALSVGSNGADVTALQNVLTTTGNYTGPVTGYFGALTKAAVQKYQTSHNVSAVGSVGPMTRAALNKDI